MFIPIGPIAGAGPLGAVVSIVAGVVAVFDWLFGSSTPANPPATQSDLKNLANTTAQAVADATRFTWTTLKQVGLLLTLLAQLFNEVLDGLLKAVKALAQLVKDIYNKVLVPALKALHTLRKILNDAYNKFIRPALAILQRVRKMLAILRIFHVHWAGVLDQKIASIQGKIIGPYIYVLRQLNGLSSWINVILTAGGVIQRGVFINSTYAWQFDWVNQFYTGQTGPPVLLPVGGGAQPAQPRSLPTVVSDLSTYVSTGQGPAATQALQASARFNLVAAA